MGNDDNTPLTGVTGGGLPAEIWHEVMIRIEADLPATALKMEIPQSKYVAADPNYQEPTYTDALPDAYVDPLPDAAGPGADADLVEQILREVLGTAGN